MMRSRRILKFLFVGAIGLLVNLGTYYLATKLHVQYLVGSTVAFLVAMCVGFILQKYWTFGDHSWERMHTQFALYAMLTLCNLAANTLVVYLLVTYANTYYLIAQTIGAGLVALVSYGIYRRYIFTGAL